MSEGAAPLGVMRRVLTLYAVLIPVNIAAWIWALVLLHDRPLLLGAAALAYGFGLRHAIDADHIAAIDNVTRKLMQEGQRPVTVGLFFAIGHSSIVFVASLLVGITAGALQQVEGLKSIGGVISTLISSGFLFAIGLINLSILRDLLRTLRGLRSGEFDTSMETFPVASGLLARVLKPLFGLIRRSWHMAPLGLLFGLGFETATEVSVMGLAASQALSGAPVAVALVFPTLFAAGMTLVDATDGVLMMRVYQWAFVDPRRKLYYNCIITLISALIAILISGIEAAGLIVDNFGFSSALSLVADLSGHFNRLGAVIVVVFIGSWLASMGFSRARRTTESVPTIGS